MIYVFLVKTSNANLFHTVQSNRKIKHMDQIMFCAKSQFLLPLNHRFREELHSKYLMQWNESKRRDSKWHGRLQSEGIYLMLYVVWLLALPNTRIMVCIYMLYSFQFPRWLVYSQMV